MAQLRQDYQSFVERKAVIIVVGPDKADVFRTYWEKHSLPFVGLPDPDHKVLKQYGQEINLFKLGRMPAQLVVDIRGHVRFVHYGHAMMDIPLNSEILTILDNLIDEESV